MQSIKTKFCHLIKLLQSQLT